MDTESLFIPGKKKPDQPIEPQKKDLWLDPSLAFAPLTYGFKLDAAQGRFDLRYGKLQENAEKLREGECDISMISPLDYAKKKETWQIIPNICVASYSGVRHVQLYFKKGLNRISNIIISPGLTVETVLLKILMQEKFQLSPEYTVISGDLDTMLAAGDAALVTGDISLDYYASRRNRLDLNEEWLDLTGFPFVYAFWAGRELTVSAEDIRSIYNSYTLGLKNLENIAKDYAREHSQTWDFYHDYLANNLSYTFNEKEKEGLNEFYHYAFFYGYIEFIPELHFFGI
ncbi:MAG: hypothetical protein E4H13_07950 [Calditrichales bacterium]|nr:MAG: hypothetical protein E4H13_07950 [Calditrichales bacterium]